eukprot:3772090-Lingulodinium_polyedra.AAC.1
MNAVSAQSRQRAGARALSGVEATCRHVRGLAADTTGHRGAGSAGRPTRAPATRPPDENPRPEA